MFRKSFKRLSLFDFRQSSAPRFKFLPGAMAPSASKNCYRNARMLVAHQNAQNNLKYPVMTKGTDGVFLIDDKDCYTDVLARMVCAMRNSSIVVCNPIFDLFSG